MNVIKEKQNLTIFDKYIVEESNNGKHLIGYYCRIKKIDEIASNFNEAHIVLHGHLNGRSTADYIQTILHCYWLIYLNS